MSEKPSRQEMVDRMVLDDIGSIRECLQKGDIAFLDSVLRGDGWKPYNQLTDQEVESEYRERVDDIGDWEPFYDVKYGKDRKRQR